MSQGSTAPRVGETVYIHALGTLRRATVEQIVGKSISCRDDDDSVRITFEWFNSIDDAVQDYIDSVNKKFYKRLIVI